MIPNRRRFIRQIVHPPAYVSLGPRRGGLLHDLSEGGLAVEVQGVPLNGQIVPVVFDLQETKNCIQTISQVAWRDKLGTRVGLEFLDLSEISQRQIKEWLWLRTFAGKHRDMTAGPEVSQIERFGAPTTRDNMKRQETLSDATDSRLVEQRLDSVTAAQKYSTNSRPAVIRPGKINQTRLREQKTAVEKESRSGKSSQKILEARHALGLFAGAVGLLVLMFILGYVLGGVHHYPQTRAVTAVDKERVHPAEASSPPAKRRPATKATESSFAAPLIPPGAVVLQVAALTQESEALALAEALRKKDFPAFVLVPSADHYYRVQVGPYADSEWAQRVRRKLEKEGFESIVKR